MKAAKVVSGGWRSPPGPQAGEWPVLRELLPDDPVTYLDVGASEADSCNNTWGFYLAGGSGILLEPNLKAVPELLECRGRDVILPAAAWNGLGWGKLKLRGHGSTLCRTGANGDDEEVAVPLITVRELSALYPEIMQRCQLCSIDVEGAERNVLLGIDWELFRPSVLIIEYIAYDPDRPGPDVSAEWTPITKGAGYTEVCRSWLNMILVHESAMERWLAIKDHVSMPDTHLKAE